MGESLIGAEALLGVTALCRAPPTSKRLDVAGTGNTTIGGVISGSMAAAMAVTKFGPGALNLNGASVNTCTAPPRSTPEFGPQLQQFFSNE
jgi:hypothetical protein